MSSIEQVLIDVDDLAKEKLNEIEKLLDDPSKNHKLGELEGWFSILKHIITAAGLHRTSDNDNQNKDKIDENIYADFGDDNEQFNQVDLTEQFASNSVKWTIRVRAFKMVHRLVRLLSDSKRSDTCLKPGKSFFKLRLLPDLVQLSFVAATSPYDDLKLQGFEMFKFVINRFAPVEETEFPGQSILDQYRTQVISALKPAFNVDAPPYITAIASQVCCLWICKGLEKNQSDIKRTYHLMTATIDKLENQSRNQNSKLFTESELEQERLDILGSWAQLYIISKETNHTPALCKFDTNYLHDLVAPHIDLLVDKWWEALRDYALLIMPASNKIATLHDNGNVYTREVALRLFAPVWPKLILASTLWLCNDNSSSKRDNKYFKFICGILLNEFCRYLNHTRSSSEEFKDLNENCESILYSLRTLDCLLKTEDFRSGIVEEMQIVQEFYSVLYSILINQVKPRSSTYLILKDTLESLLKLIIRKITDCRSECLPHVFASLSTMIKKDLEGIRSAPSNANQKTNLFIRIDTVINLIMALPIIIVEQTDTRSEAILIFQEILNFENDHSVPAYLLRHLKDLDSKLPQDISSIINDGLTDAKANALSRFMLSTKVSDDKNHATVPQTHDKTSEGATKMRNNIDQLKYKKKSAPKIVLKADFSNFYSSQQSSHKGNKL